MQSVKIGKLLRQLAVLISRNFQLIWNQKLTLGSLILQAPLMVLVIKLVGEPDLLYLQPDQHRQPHGAVHCVRHGVLYGAAELLPRDL